jgi:citrate lyase subunit beta/citryl-CoA lyase
MKHYSYLFVPGDRPERFDKAADSGAHAIILDLEDAVAPDRKEMARAAVASWLGGRPAGGMRIVLRLNAADSAWYVDDLGVLGAPALSAVMLPKAQDAAVLAALTGRLRGDQVALPLVETVAGLDQARHLASVDKVERLVFGSVDFNADAGIGGDGEELNVARSLLVLASRLGGAKAPIDGVSLALTDTEALTADVLRARRFGFGAKLCIHPKQVAGVNAGFAPSTAEVQWATRVREAVAKDGLGAIAVDGKLVDKPVYALAQAILEEAGV